ncbi:MAG TPA: hypothetical protein HPP76_06045 [Desulfuromonadales bacterium]|nr:hypothetical protein [Desulfuromonadales bacterium]
MTYQHAAAYFVDTSQVHRLQKVDALFDEGWIQNFIFNHPESLPIDEIEPAFGPLLPVCRELRTKAGFADIIFINPLGLITIVECKLWKNPEARREVIGQILDYAKELAGMSYEEFERIALASQGGSIPSLYQIASTADDTLDEQTFIDRVTRNLKRGRFQLLIAGDGIREGVEQITSFLQQYGNLNFTLALVEYSLFKQPGEGSNGFFVMPRILARTYEIERAVVRIEGNGIAVTSPASLQVSSKFQGQRTTVSEQVFIENLQLSPQVKERFHAMLQQAKQQGMYTQPGSNSLILKTDTQDLNLAIFKPNGTFYNTGIASRTNDFGLPEIGERYLVELAGLIPGAYCNRSKNRFDWSVKTSDGNPKIENLLAVQDQWFDLVASVIEELSAKYNKSLS